MNVSPGLATKALKRACAHTKITESLKCKCAHTKARTSRWWLSGCFLLFTANCHCCNQALPCAALTLRVYLKALTRTTCTTWYSRAPSATTMCASLRLYWAVMRLPTIGLMRFMTCVYKLTHVNLCHVQRGHKSIGVG